MKLNKLSIFRMDEQVLYTMAGICIISILVLAFRISSEKSCTDVNIGYGKDSIYVNEVVHFSPNNKSGKEYNWDFGDGITSSEFVSTATHKYKEARIYTVKVLMDGKCTDIQTLTVYERKPQLTLSPEIIFVGIPPSATVNDKVNFTGLADGATTYEWKLEGSQEIISRAASFTHVFKTPGNKKFELTINKGRKNELTNFNYINIQPKAEEPENSIVQNGGRARGGRPVIINAEPESPPIQNNPVEPVSPNKEVPKPEAEKLPKKGPDLILSNEQFEAFLFDFYEGKKSVADFTPYLCDNVNITVSYDKGNLTFSDFCAALKRIKKLSKIDIIASRNQNNCIFFMQVKTTRRHGPGGILKSTTD